MKAITADNYIVRPFVTHKAQVYQVNYLNGGNPSQISIDLATAPPVPYSWQSGSEPINPSGVPQRTLFASIQNLFYSSHSFWNAGSTFTKGFTPSGSAYVISLAQPSYGESIQRGSFTVLGGNSTVLLYDNGDGQIVSTANTGSVVGNIFYSLGIAVIKNAGAGLITSVLGMNLASGSIVNVNFNATQTIYEHQIMCTIDAGEFNYTSNPSMVSTTMSGQTVISQFGSGSLTPYMTTVGIYNSQQELLAIAKFPRPIKRAVDGTQTVIIRFDA
jgi:hypothetical protein